MIDWQNHSSDLVHITDLVVQRGDFTLNVPEWRVPPGTVVGVVGPNGAGKTTLLRLLPGLDAPDQGQVKVLGMSPTRQTAQVRAQVGWMSDDQPLFNVRVHKLVRLLSGYYATWDAELTGSLLERFGINPLRKVNSLSKGEGTRLRLVLALAFGPRLLVLDEPGTGLDLGGRRALLDIVLDVVRDAHRSVIISSHQIADIERIADRLLVLDHGRVIQRGATPDLVPPGRTLEEQMVHWEGEPRRGAL